jgi:hypothetical protein
LRNDIIFRTLYKTLLSADKAAKVVKIYELRNKNLLHTLFFISSAIG